MGKIHWIPTEGPERIEESDTAPSNEEMKAFVGGWTEHVNVLYEGVFPTSMFVKDDGRVLNLPVNRVATEIYWAASKARGVDLANKEERDADAKAFWESRGIDPDQVHNIDPRPDDPPFIHGPAVLLEGIKLD